MEIRQIKYFLAIADNGSVSRAAQRLFIAQSALSKQVSDLEVELGVQLLHRSRSGVFLTDSGKVFYEYAQGILKQINEAKEAVRYTHDVVVGTIALGIPQSASLALALPLMNYVQKRFPNIVLHLNEELTGNLVDQLVHGRVDLAVFTSNVPLPGFTFTPIIEEDLYLIGSKASGLDMDDSDVSLKDAIASPLLLSGVQHSHCLRMIVEDAAAAQGLGTLNVAGEVNSVHILKIGVEVGQARTIMPLALVAEEVAQKRLIAKRIRPDHVTRTLGVLSSSALPATNAKKIIALAVKDTIVALGRNGSWPSLHELPPTEVS